MVFYQKEKEKKKKKKRHREIKEKESKKRVDIGHRSSPIHRAGISGAGVYSPCQHSPLIELVTISWIYLKVMFLAVTGIQTQFLVSGFGTIQFIVGLHDYFDDLEGCKFAAKLGFTTALGTSIIRAGFEWIKAKSGPGH